MTMFVITILMPPGLLAINDKFEVAPIRRKGRVRYEIRLTSSARAAIDEAIVLVRQAVASARWRTRERVCASIVTHWAGYEGDVDATVKATLDALESGGVVVNDAEIRPLWLDARYNAQVPRIVVKIFEARSDLIADLVNEDLERPWLEKGET